MLNKLSESQQSGPILEQEVVDNKTKSPFWSWTGLYRLLGIEDFALPMQAWQRSSNIILSILLASFLVNLLSLAFPLALLQIYDRIIPNVAYNTLVLLVMGVGTALVLEALLRVCRSYVGAWADSKFEHVIGIEAFKHLVESPMQVYEQEGSGIHLRRMNSLNMLRDFYAGQAIISMVDIPFIVILLALIVYIAGWLVLVPITMVFVFIFSTIRLAKKIQGILEKKQGHDERRFNFIIQTLGNIHTVKSITMEAQMLRRYERLQKTSSVYDYDMSWTGSKSMTMGLAMSQLTIVLVVAFGSMLVIRGDLTIGGLAACTLLSGRSLQPINAIISVWTRLQSIKVAREELDEVLSLPLESDAHLPKLPTVQSNIEFQDVSFRYSDDDAFVINHLNLTISKNQCIGIMGGSRSGKSTLMRLLLGMLRPTEGKIRVGGEDISQYQVQSVREKFGYMPQHGVLFNGTIMENLTMFQEDKYFDAAYEASRLVGLDIVISQLPKGYDTRVADQAIEVLPAGVKQRITVARALVRKPPILIFDEANASIDMQGDIILKEMLQKLIGQCTLLLISHRPSILEIAEKTYFLEKGQLRSFE